MTFFNNQTLVNKNQGGAVIVSCVMCTFFFFFLLICFRTFEPRGAFYIYVEGEQKIARAESKMFSCMKKQI